MGRQPKKGILTKIKKKKVEILSGRNKKKNKDDFQREMEMMNMILKDK